ncbi:MAG: class I SAM-dependent methyltransferase [Mycobacteriales bacterium]
MPLTPHYDPALVARLREALERSDFTVDGVGAVFDPVAHAALAREQVVPALRATTGGTPLETLVRLFLLGATEPLAAVRSALSPLSIDESVSLRLLEPDGDGFRAGLEIRPYGDEAHSWWVVSEQGTDVRPGPLPAQHVLGVGGASVTLAEWTVRQQVGSALDIGTGCGVQSLHLSQHATQVTATDRNPIALALARLTAQLNGLEWELLEGDLFEPVGDRTFDLIVSNPPFVVGPATRDYLYRDSGLEGDAVTRSLVQAAPNHLTEGGWCQLLGNWVHVRGQPFGQALTRWLSPRNGCDVWIVRRAVQDPAEYVEMWLRDSGEADGPAYRRKYADWLDWFAAHDIEAIGFGVITMRNAGHEVPSIEIWPEDMTAEIERPIGRQVADWFTRRDRLRGIDLLDAHLVRAPGLRLEQIRAASTDGWTLTEQWLRQHGGLGSRVLVLDDVMSLVVAGANGDVTLRQQLELIAAAFEVDAKELALATVDLLTQYVGIGLLDIAHS